MDSTKEKTSTQLWRASVLVEFKPSASYYTHSGVLHVI